MRTLYSSSRRQIFGAAACLLTTIFPVVASRAQDSAVAGLPAALPSAPVAALPPVHPAVPKPAFRWEDLRAQAPLTEDGSLQLTVPQVCHIAADSEARAVLSGKSVQIIAQLKPDSADAGTRRWVRASRQQLACCAAHARSYELRLDFGPAGSPQSIPAWAVVTGRMRFERQGLELSPIVEVTSFKEIPVPVQPMVD
jgi:hypothetical protein